MAEEDEEPPSGLNHLPRELLFDIFSRCPPKILYRLRCVCSKWLSILTFDADFISLYHRHHRLSPLLLSSASDGRNSTVSASCRRADSGLLRFKFKLAVDSSGDLKSTISNHGIACFVFDSKVLIFDPATSRASELPISPNFGFTASVAFGFSAISGEFKLVHLYRLEKFDNYHYSKVKELMCEVFSVQSRSLGFEVGCKSRSCENWRFLGKCPIDVLGRKSYVSVNENIYWLVAEKSYNPNCVRILSFDLVMEDFGIVCFPRSCSNRSVECLGLLEVNNKLCLTDKLPWETTMAIWELNSSVWTKKYEIDLCRFDRHDMRILGHSPAVGGGSGELVIKIGMKDAVLYDLDKATFREIARHQDGDEDESDAQLELQSFLNRKHLL